VQPANQPTIIKWLGDTWHSVFVGKPARKRTLGKPRHRWEGTITMELKYNERAPTVLIWLRIGMSCWPLRTK
jgi:hypothetical protein